MAVPYTSLLEQGFLEIWFRWIAHFHFDEIIIILHHVDEGDVVSFSDLIENPPNAPYWAHMLECDYPVGTSGITWEDVADEQAWRIIDTMETRGQLRASHMAGTCKHSSAGRKQTDRAIDGWTSEELEELGEEDEDFVDTSDWVAPHFRYFGFDMAVVRIDTCNHYT